MTHDSILPARYRLSLALYPEASAPSGFTHERPPSRPPSSPSFPPSRLPPSFLWWLAQSPLTEDNVTALLPTLHQSRVLAVASYQPSESSYRRCRFVPCCLRVLLALSFFPRPVLARASGVSSCVVQGLASQVSRTETRFELPTNGVAYPLPEASTPAVSSPPQILAALWPPDPAAHTKFLPRTKFLPSGLFRSAPSASSLCRWWLPAGARARFCLPRHVLAQEQARSQRSSIHHEHSRFCAPTTNAHPPAAPSVPLLRSPIVLLYRRREFPPVAALCSSPLPAAVALYVGACCWAALLGGGPRVSSLAAMAQDQVI
jgi:hypothetical protein